MKKYVFTVKDDVCAANNKPLDASELLVVMQKYGVVEDYEKVVAGVSNEYQSSIDGLTRQLTAIKEQELTDDEIVIVKAYRAQKANVTNALHAQISERDNQLRDIKSKHEQMSARIVALLGE